MASRSSMPVPVSSDRSLWPGSHEGCAEGTGTLCTSFPGSGSTVTARGRVDPDGWGLSTRSREGSDSSTGSSVMGLLARSGT
eukprot:1026625-Rhodomonas_salina.2